MTYFAELKLAVMNHSGCQAEHVITTPVKEVFRGKIAWAGEVEVYRLIGHQNAQRAYAWGFPVDDDAKDREITVVLEIPPVFSAETAVKAALAAHAKKSLSG